MQIRYNIFNNILRGGEMAKFTPKKKKKVDYLDEEVIFMVFVVFVYFLILCIIRFTPIFINCNIVIILQKYHEYFNFHRSTS